MKHSNMGMVLGLVALLGLSPAHAEMEDALGEKQERTAEGEARETFGSERPWSFHLGTGMAIYGGSPGFAVGTGVLNRIGEEDSPLFWGADLAMNFWQFSSAVAASSQGATGISLMPGLVYALDLGRRENFRPYVGLSAGMMLYMEDRVSALGATTSESRVFLQVMLRPGANIGITRRLTVNLEPRFGLLGSGFIFMPMASAVVAL